ncbi:MAG: HAD family hydrolase [Rhodospirillaceae bacterium]|nr:HAD family hydrolase [Rhodospirillaceae bacterium]OUT76489.1 MAG: HAD family hydrolase [Rhodospirillaceae bacterium TMED23]|tara:strand:+ start:2344 stop:2850 length:507 start_codon:yes stop_codon:yes gene_type:complete
MNKNLNTKFINALKKIEILSLDTDGVLTDGGLYYTEEGTELRKFNVKDGMGIKMIRDLGIKVFVLTASETNSIISRGKKLGVDGVFIGCHDKLSQLKRLADQFDTSFDRIGHVGDDLNDLPVLNVVGCSMTVADAVPAIIEAADFVTDRKGGDAAVREICDLIIALRS